MRFRLWYTLFDLILEWLVSSLTHLFSDLYLVIYIGSIFIITILDFITYIWW